MTLPNSEYNETEHEENKVENSPNTPDGKVPLNERQSIKIHINLNVSYIPLLEYPDQTKTRSHPVHELKTNRQGGQKHV